LTYFPQINNPIFDKAQTELHQIF